MISSRNIMSTSAGSRDRERSLSISFAPELGESNARALRPKLRISLGVRREESITRLGGRLRREEDRRRLHYDDHRLYPSLLASRTPVLTIATTRCTSRRRAAQVDRSRGEFGIEHIVVRYALSA